MIFLLLIVFLAAVGSFIAVPLFEFTFGALLLVPVVRFLIGYLALKVGIEVPNGAPSFLLYVVSFALVTALAHRAFGRRKGEVTRDEVYPIVFFGVIFLVAYGMCLLWPDFVDLGERLRDYAILSSGIASPVVPKEPWMDGATLNYYVYWYRFGNLLSSTLGLEVWQIYHVMLSLSMALYAAVIYQIVRVIVRGSIITSAFAGVLIPFGCNVAGIFSLTRAEGGKWVHDNGWWGASRVIAGAIDEFPAWSFLLGDAHPHYLNLAAFPFFLLILFRILASSGTFLVRGVQAALFVVGATLFLMASNAWEVPMWLGTVGAVAVFGWMTLYSGISMPKVRFFEGKPVFEIVKGVTATIILLAALFGALRFFDPKEPLQAVVLLVVGIGFFVYAFPFKKFSARDLFAGCREWKRIPVLWVAFWVLLFVALKLSSSHIAPEGLTLDRVKGPIAVTTTNELLVHWGVQLGLITLASILLLESSLASVVMVLFLGVSLLFDKAALYLLMLLAVQAVRILSAREKGTEERDWRVVFEHAILVSGLVLILVPEFVFINDSYGGDIERMNTIFKLYTTAWGLLGLGAVSLLSRCFKDLAQAGAGTSTGLPQIAAALLTLVVSASLIPFYYHTVPMRRGGLESKGATRAEGLATADKWHPGSATVVRVLRTLPRGRVLEAQGKAYSYSNFVATLSAQPSYLGWANHINLLTKKGDEVARRLEVIKRVYNESDCETRKRIAREEQIRYIVVGTLEEKAFPGVQERDFSCFASAAKAGSYSLYQIPM